MQFEKSYIPKNTREGSLANAKSLCICLLMSAIPGGTMMVTNMVCLSTDGAFEGLTNIDLYTTCITPKITATTKTYSAGCIFIIIGAHIV